MGSNLSFLSLMAVVAAFVLTAFAAVTPATAEPQTLEYSSTGTSAEFTPVSHHVRICCKRGRSDWWTTPNRCYRAGGYRVSARYCRNDWQQEVRVCCKRGRYDWWTTPRACARSGGYRVAGWQCRNG